MPNLNSYLIFLFYVTYFKYLKEYFLFVFADSIDTFNGMFGLFHGPNLSQFLNYRYQTPKVVNGHVS